MIVDIHEDRWLAWLAEYGAPRPKWWQFVLRYKQWRFQRDFDRRCREAFHGSFFDKRCP